MTTLSQKPASDDPGAEFHMMMGYCIAEWAKVDDELFRIFRDCVGPYDQCAIIYYRVPGLDARVGLTDELVLSILPETSPGGPKHDDVKRWDRIRKTFPDLLAVRRRIAHQPVRQSRRFLAGSLLNAVPFNTLPFNSPPIADSWYAIYVNQHERLRRKEADKAPLTIDDLKDHVIAVSGLSGQLNLFFHEVLRKPPATPSPPNHPPAPATSMGHSEASQKRRRRPAKSSPA